MNKWWECPQCKGLLNNQDLENEKGKNNPCCKHCGMKFYEGIEFKGISFRCGKCNIIHDDPNCPQCGQNNNVGHSPEKSKKPASTGEEINHKENFRKLVLDYIEQNKDRIGKGGKWKHCQQTFDKVEEFIEHFKQCLNLPSSMSSGVSFQECKECGFFNQLSSSGGVLFEGHNCIQLKKDKNNNCSVCNKEIKEQEIGKHKECLEKLSQKSSLGLKLEQTKNNPKMLMVLGGGISLIVIGIVGIIISAVKLSKLAKEKNRLGIFSKN